MRRDQPHAAEMALPDRPLLSLSTRIELAAIVFAFVAFYALKPALEGWIRARAEAVQTSALGQCRPPSEFEQLHVVVLNRAGRLVAGGCMYVGARGTYRR